MCMDIRIRHYDALGMTYIDIYTDRSIECISFWGKLAHPINQGENSLIL